MRRRSSYYCGGTRPTVLHVCRRVLRDAEAVEDAFQATFLVFVRKAGSISRRESLGGWLYRVAYRIALKARERIAKRKAMEQEGQSPDLSDPLPEDAEQRELRRIVCEEVDRLPAKYRAAIVACFFEGKTHEEAAAQLGWPRGSVASRVARGRDLLHRRLLRRGVALTAGALGTALSVQTSSAALRGVNQTTIQTVKLFAAGSSAGAVVPPSIAALVEGVLQAMYWTRVKIVMVVLFVAGLGGAGATFWAAPPKATKSPSESGQRAEALPPPGGGKAKQPQDADKLAHNMAQSRLNLRELARAMHNYADTYQGTMPPAIYDKTGKALLSWRVALLPYLDHHNLYKQFHLHEPWDSEHNKNLLKLVPKEYVPVGKPETPHWRTYYQVFISDPPTAKSFVTAAFIKGLRPHWPAYITDGTANTILIVEAGNAVPWTKPEDLPYAADKPLPKLGGLFPDVFQAAFGDGSVHILKKKYDETTLRNAITCNDGHLTELDKIEAKPSRPAAAAPGLESALEEWQRKNDALRRRLVREQESIRELKDLRKRFHDQSKKDKGGPISNPRLEALKQENCASARRIVRSLCGESDAARGIQGIAGGKARDKESASGKVTLLSGHAAARTRNHENGLRGVAMLTGGVLFPDRRPV